MTGIALLGAGLFAKKQHLPAIEAASGLELLAIYSRSKKSADDLAGAAKSKVDTYHDSPSEKDKSLDDLLARSDIKAVIVVLPIQKQPEFIKKALAAGKHVLSEKPAAPTVAVGNELLNWYKSLSNPPLWGIAENFRFSPAITRAAEKAKQLKGKGKLISFRLISYQYVKEDNEWYNTEWRKTPEHQGGFLFDGGIHSIAALRLILEAAGHRITKVACFSRLIEDRLLPVDTLNAVLGTEDGSSGTLTMSFGAEFKSTSRIEVVTTEGDVIWSRDQVKSKFRGQEEKVDDIEFDTGVKAEVAAFAESISSGKINPLLAVEQGMKDVEFMEAMFRSGETGASMKTLEL